MASLSMAHVAALQGKLKSAQARMESVKKKANEVVEHVVDTALVGGTALGLGMLQGRTGGITLPGNIPLELAAAGGALTLGAFGIGGKHAFSVGNGALAAFATTWGRAKGKELLAKENERRAALGQPPTGDGIKLLAGTEKPAEQVVNAAPARVRRGG